MCDGAGNRHLSETCTGAERTAADGGDGAGDVNGCELPAEAERAPADGLDSAGQRHACEGGAAREGALADFVHAVGNDHRFQRRAADERLFVNAADRTSQCDALHAGAVIERRLSDGADGIGNSDACHLALGVKRHAPDAVHGIGNDHVAALAPVFLQHAVHDSEIRVIAIIHGNARGESARKIRVLPFLLGAGIIDGTQRVAIEEGEGLVVVDVDGRRLGKQVDRRQLFVVGKGALLNVLNGGGDGHCRHGCVAEGVGGEYLESIRQNDARHLHAILKGGVIQLGHAVRNRDIADIHRRRTAQQHGFVLIVKNTAGGTEIGIVLGHFNVTEALAAVEQIKPHAFHRRGEGHAGDARAVEGSVADGFQRVRHGDLRHGGLTVKRLLRDGGDALGNHHNAAGSGIALHHVVLDGQTGVIVIVHGRAAVESVLNGLARLLHGDGVPFLLRADVIHVLHVP